MNRKKGDLRVYLRFLNSMSASGVVVTYSNPVSISAVASFTLLVALHVHSSDWVKNSACSRFMYIIVEAMALCPKTFLTCSMSLVLWYSIVPFQCRKVCKRIWSSLGLFSFLAVRLRRASKVLLWLSGLI